MSACANRTTDHTARPVVPGEPGHRTTNQRETVWVSSQAEAQGCPTVMSRPRRLVDAPTGRHSYTLHAGTVRQFGTSGAVGNDWLTEPIYPATPRLVEPYCRVGRGVFIVSPPHLMHGSLHCPDAD